MRGSQNFSIALVAGLVTSNTSKLKLDNALKAQAKQETVLP